MFTDPSKKGVKKGPFWALPEKDPFLGGSGGRPKSRESGELVQNLKKRRLFEISNLNICSGAPARPFLTDLPFCTNSPDSGSKIETVVFRVTNQEH